MAASLLLQPGPFQVASIGSERAPQLIRIENFFTGGDLCGSKRQGCLGRFHGRRPAGGHLAGSLVVLRANGVKAGYDAAQDAVEPGEELKYAKDGAEVFPKRAQTAQGITHSKFLDPLASLFVGLALGAAALNASRGHHVWKSTAVPCFASISTAIPENSVAEKTGSEAVPIVAPREGVKSAAAEEILEDSAPEAANQGKISSGQQFQAGTEANGWELSSSEQLQTETEASQGEPSSSEQLQPETEAPNLSIESVTTVPPEQEVGDSLQVSGRGSQEYLGIEVGVIQTKPEGGAIGTVSQSQQSTHDISEEDNFGEGVGDETPEVEEIDENDIDDEDEDEDVDDEDEDDYQEEEDDTRIVQRNDVAVIGDVLGNTGVDANQREESDESNIFPEEEEELRQAYEEWKVKPYALTVPLKIVGLRSSVPPVWLKDFLQSQGKNVKLAMQFQGSLKSILAGLAEAAEKQQINARSIMAADLVTIGDSWLGTAVAGGLIEPIKNPEQQEWYHRLGSRWQTLLRRNRDGLLDPKGKIWGVPYRWGTLVVAYRTDKFNKFHVAPIKDWGDLFEPDLEAKVAIVDSPREVVGLVLKSLGSSFNTKDFEKEVAGGRQAVKDRFLALQKQVRLFDSVQYLKALGAGDVWVAVGWSSDVIPFAKRTSNIEVVVPSSGTSLWADLWAVPATRTIKSDRAGGRVRGPSPLVQQWFDFCLQPARALSFQQDVFVGASPLALPPSEIQAGDESSTRATGGSLTHSSTDLSEIKPSDREQQNGRTMRDDDVAFLEAPEILPIGVALNADSNTLQSSVPDDVVARSEFLEPLSDTAVTDFQWLLDDVVEVSGWPSDIIEFLKGALQNFQKWIWARGIRY